MRQLMDTAQAEADQRAQQSGEPFEVDPELRDMLLEQGRDYLQLSAVKFDSALLSEGVSSAYGAYSNALQMDPASKEAAEGIVEIVRRYESEAAAPAGRRRRGTRRRARRLRTQDPAGARLAARHQARGRGGGESGRELDVDVPTRRPRVGARPVVLMTLAAGDNGRRPLAPATCGVPTRSCSEFGFERRVQRGADYRHVVFTKRRCCTGGRCMSTSRAMERPTSLATMWPPIRRRATR